MNLNRMQRKIDRLSSIFIKLIDALNEAIEYLTSKISDNTDHIRKLEDDNYLYQTKIEEYKSFKTNVEHIVK